MITQFVGGSVLIRYASRHFHETPRVRLATIITLNIVEVAGARHSAMSKLYFLGICGTFMGSLAVIARQLGHDVAGCDANVYPPMSDQLRAQGIHIDNGYDASHLVSKPDLVIVGNAMTRNNPLTEASLESDLRFISGPQWLYENVLHGRHVLALSGTHGKTTTSSMLTWILRENDDPCGYLIGGVPLGIDASADIGRSRNFVIEADEYDTAFFDKRSKFVHYHPRTLVINNLEFDHADIFDDIEAIQWQFHQMIRIMPASSLVLVPAASKPVAKMLERGCWSRTETLSLGVEDDADWWVEDMSRDGSVFTVKHRHCNQKTDVGRVEWQLTGQHNVSNGLAAIAAAADVGISPQQAAAALSRFPGVKRRLEKIGEARGVTIIDDFAHHPTAIRSTLEAVRAAGAGRVIAVIEPRSNSMRLGVHREQLPASVVAADVVYWYQPPGAQGDLKAVATASLPPSRVLSDVKEIITEVVAQHRAGDTVVIMSNGGFEGIHMRLLETLRDSG